MLPDARWALPNDFRDSSFAAGDEIGRGVTKQAGREEGMLLTSG
jgi:hypothetical protein